MVQTAIDKTEHSSPASATFVDAVAGFSLAYYALGYRLISPLAARLDFPYAGAFANHAWMFIVSAFWLLVLRRRFPVGAPRWRDLRGWAAPFAATLVVSLCALGWALLSIKHTELRSMADTSAAAILFQGTISGLGEEFLFRGLIQTGLNNSLKAYATVAGMRIGLGTLLAALLFGGLHLMNAWYGEPVRVAVVQACFGCLVGLGLGVGYERTNNIWGAVITHNVANVVNTVLLALALAV